MPMKTVLVSLLAITYVIFESIWATVLLENGLKVFYPIFDFNFWFLFGFCAVTLNLFDVFYKCDYQLKAALRLNIFVWLLLITVVQFSIDMV